MLYMNSCNKKYQDEMWLTAMVSWGWDKWCTMNHVHGPTGVPNGQWRYKGKSSSVWIYVDTIYVCGSQTSSKEQQLSLTVPSLPFSRRGNTHNARTHTISPLSLRGGDVKLLFFVLHIFEREREREEPKFLRGSRMEQLGAETGSRGGSNGQASRDR